MVTLVRPVQPENAERPMVVTELPMLTLVKPLQPENAEELILVIELGIIKFFTSVPFRKR